MKAINYLNEIEQKPLTEQLNLVKLQINHFHKMSKGKMSLEEKKVLLASWEGCNQLRKDIYSQIQEISNWAFTNN